ncbi:MAG: type II toxin-antitoxin system RelB/DinJ family antitoxin [Candidatus Margulisbacteria bacterium]|jgi:addiction module RelB/DinJ family antitoxin|nr:type II toxin-antitoxin system RelB/DinJ family antitoxin [Candidatus Margulisiibacteriota bacterium]
MTARTLVQARVDSELKTAAEKILEFYGLDIPTLFRMALRATVNKKGVPFPLGQTTELTAADYSDFQTADRAYTTFVKSGKKTNPMRKLAKKLGL